MSLNKTLVTAKEAKSLTVNSVQHSSGNINELENAIEVCNSYIQGAIMQKHFDTYIQLNRLNPNGNPQLINDIKRELHESGYKAEFKKVKITILGDSWYEEAVIINWEDA